MSNYDIPSPNPSIFTPPFYFIVKNGLMVSRCMDNGACKYEDTIRIQFDYVIVLKMAASRLNDNLSSCFRF